jgi:hypothetical protein
VMVQLGSLTPALWLLETAVSDRGYNAAIKATDLTASQARLGQIEIALDAA